MQSERPSPMRVDGWTLEILMEIKDTLIQPNNPTVEEVCNLINLVMVNESGEVIKKSEKKKPTDLDLGRMQKKYLSRETIVSILDAAWTFNGAKELN